jgi:heme A synthase
MPFWVHAILHGYSVEFSKNGIRRLFEQRLNFMFKTVAYQQGVGASTVLTGIFIEIMTDFKKLVYIKHIYFNQDFT